MAKTKRAKELPEAKTKVKPLLVKDLFGLLKRKGRRVDTLAILRELDEAEERKLEWLARRHGRNKKARK